MPKVKGNENKDAFISRCISETTKEGKPQKQAAAICHNIWKHTKRGGIAQAMKGE